MSAKARRLPPYGVTVQRQLRAGRRANIYLFTGTAAWRRASDRERACGDGTAMVLPLDADPAGFRWPAVPALVVEITGMEGDRVKRLVAALIRDGVRMAALCDARQVERHSIVRAAP